MSFDQESDTINKKRKREISHYDYGTKCICSNELCDNAMKILKEHNPGRYAYFGLPNEPKPLSELKSKPRDKLVAQRLMKAQRRMRILKALPRDATRRVTDPRYNNARHNIASLHFHDDIFNLCKETNGRIYFVDSIPADMARRLRLEGLEFTDADKYPDHTYVPLPNIPIADFIACMGRLNDQAKRARVTQVTEERLSPRRAAVTAESMENTRLKEDLLRQETRINGEHLKNEERKKALDLREKELEQQKSEMKNEMISRQQNMNQNMNEMKNEMRTRQKDVNEKWNMIGRGDKSYGLTRSSLLSRAWHEKNPTAARHLFGFSSWKVLVCFFHAVFGLLPPSVVPINAKSISLFEQKLMGYLRIHCRMTVYNISFIWNRSTGHTGRLVNNAVKIIGCVGKDLSILDITPEYLEATCPQAYKDEGLEKCCAVPDGKDFMIYTTRKNTLFSRASYSDKMHHSAVRCISWSTPQGLSFEHTDLFLGRASEKRLVELWSPRFKKCPRGWFMLSDRGFFDTARFYPNMNHQKTPKFLSGRNQFTTGEVSADRRICKLRYTCEVAFSRVTKTRGLRDVISNDFFPLLDAMNHWGHATVNLDAPLMN